MTCDYKIYCTAFIVIIDKPALTPFHCPGAIINIEKVTKF